MRDLIAIPERHPGKTISAVGLLFATAYALSLILLPKPDGRMLIGDALHHYVQLRSVVFDRDLQFQNEYMRMYGLERPDPETRWIFMDLTKTGHVRNVMPVGPALLWAPAFLLVTLIVWIANLAGASYPLDGYGRVFQATAGLTGTAAAALGVWLAYRTCAELFSTRHAVWSSIVLWLSSSAVYYSVISPTYSHAASLLATSAFWYAFVRTRERPDLSRYLLLGALAGVTALMRWQDALLMIVVAADLVWRFRGGVPVQRLFVWGLASAGAAAVVFIPQMAVWQVLYGRPLAIPQGSGFMHWSQPALIEVLFSSRRGLLTWTPVVAAALVGLVPLFRRDRFLALPALLFFVASCYVNAAVADWWAGEAFGARRFVSCFPIFALGLAALLDRWSPTLKTLAITSVVVVAHTFLLLVQYQAYMKGLHNIAPYPGSPHALWLARFRVPFDLMRWWLDR
jgi:Dolichyl-phosphate-mannose-protein mannosyltransferase